MTDDERIIELRQAGLPIPAIAAILNIDPADVIATEVGGVPLPGGSDVEIKEFGEDIPLLNGWVAVDPVTGLEGGARLVKIGDRVFAEGLIVKPVGVSVGEIFAVTPLGWRPVYLQRFMVTVDDKTVPGASHQQFYSIQRDPDNPGDLGSDDSGYGILFLQGASPSFGAAASVAPTSSRCRVYLTGSWNVEDPLP